MEKVEVTLIARGNQASEPWIWKLCKNFNVSVNIIKANVEPTYGSMLVEFEGPVEEIQRATAWLLTTGIHVEAKQRSVGVQEV